MPEFQFSAAAQHWANVVLIWIGFGSLAGLLARIVLPVREPSGPLPTLALGIAGSAVGLALLTWASGIRALNPISPLGFFAAGGGAVLLLAFYQLVHALRAKPNGRDGQPDEKP
jgi:uncharacterized membrane protein YeaQ/YmgE (transglycosylase-associated protein family)